MKNFVFIIKVLFFLTIALCLVYLNYGFFSISYVLVIFICIVLAAFTLALGLLSKLLKGSSFSKFIIKAAIVPLFCICLLVGLTINNYEKAEMTLPFDKQSIVAVEGILVQDSSLSSSDNMLILLQLKEAETKQGCKASSKGLLWAVKGEKDIIAAGTYVRLQGSFYEDLDLFKTESWQIIKEGSRWSDFRLRLIRKVQGHLGEDEKSELASALLLGRNDTNNSNIKELAKKAGCTHVLALSGLHLSFYSALFFFVKNKKLKNILSLSFCTLIVCIIGSKASLLRACLFMGLGTLNKMFDLKLSSISLLFICCILQLLIFPLTMIGFGALYSYIALLGILAFSNPLISRIKRFIPIYLATFLCISICAISTSAIINIVDEGLWYPISILLTPFASLLVMLFMLVSILKIEVLMNLLYKWLKSLFIFGSNFNALGLKGYVVGVLFVLTILALLKYSQLSTRFKREHDELEIQLRFTYSNQDFVAREFTSDEQEIWSELFD